MPELTGEVALITGASGGIGEAIARRLAAAGARLVLQGRRAERLAQLALEIHEHSSADYPAPLVLTGELTDPSTAAALVKQILQEYGRLDILVNNAGIHRDNLLLRMKPEEWQDVLEVNLHAVFRLTQAALWPMLRARHGRIVLVSSVVGLMGNAGQANYAASKAALIGLARSLAREVATRGITVNVVAPGFIQVGMTTELTAGQRQELIARVPMEREGSAEEVAEAVCFFCQPNSAYITGQVLAVDGGLSMGH
ncbi:MAG: 3-oxoacyl-ACP reductase FabG [Limnochordaceae bacterium]|nr:3-oxoacyl-ACP reductase FabG [Limnochordaceae bacterium]